MKRFAVCGLFLVSAMLVVVARDCAAQTSILFSGQSSVIIDTNGNGIPDDADGGFSGALGSNSLLFFGGQGTGPGTHLLRALTGDFQFNVVQLTQALASLQQTGAPNVTPPIKPANFAALVASQPSGGSTFTHLSVQTGGQPSSGGVCQSSGSPVTQVTLSDGLTMNVSLAFFPGANDPNFLVIPNVPFQETNGQFFVTSVFLPVTTSLGTLGAPTTQLTMASSNNPSSPFFRLVLNQLPACTNATSVPSLHGWALILAMLVLMTLGVWRLGKRRAFYEALPLP